MGVEISQEEDKENEQPMQEVKKKRRVVVQAVRQSDRVKDKDIPVALKAEIRTSKKNLDGGNSNSFAVFSSLDRDQLKNIAEMSNIMLGKNDIEIDRNIDIICAREEAQAALYKARKRLEEEAEEAKKKEEGRTDTILVEGDEGMSEENSDEECTIENEMFERSLFQGEMKKGRRQGSGQKMGKGRRRSKCK